MDFKREKFVRFEDWKSDQSSSSEWQHSTEDGIGTRSRSMIGSVVGRTRSGFERVSKGIKSFKTFSGTYRRDDQPTKELGSRVKILDPQGKFLQRWNKIFVLTCVIAVAVDPLFLYIPVIDRDATCLSLDNKLDIIACVLRTFVDIFYILHIIFQFRTGFIAPSSRVFGRGELIDDPRAIAKKYLSSYFIIDVLSILPLPQVAIFVIIPQTNGPVALVTKEFLKAVIFCQYVPRLLRICPLYKEVTRTAGIFAETAWAGAAFNLLIYMLASHVVGAIWYLFAIERQDRCWQDACAESTDSCDRLYCTEGVDRVLPQTDSCALLEPSDIKNSTDFDFGIFLDALKSHIVEKGDFPKKFFYCFWWGLRSLSSLGQNLKTSTFVGEIVFAASISILGLVLFSLLIGNMQKYLQSITKRVEEMRVKRRDAEQWMSHRMLPENLRERIRRYEQYKWQETRGVEEESLISNLPKDIRRDLKRHLCWSLLKRVPMFEKMDEQLLDAMCDRLKPVLYTQTSFIVREGDPVDDEEFVHLEGLYECSIFSTYIPGSELPDWFSTKSVGPLISMQMPPLPLPNLRILGFNIYILYAYYTIDGSARDVRTTWLNQLHIRVSNKTKNLKWFYSPTFVGMPEIDDRMLWLSHWKIGNQLEVGDEVDILVLEKGFFQVKEVGFNLVYDEEKAESTSYKNVDPCCQSIISGVDLSEYEVKRASFFLCNHNHKFHKLCSSDDSWTSSRWYKNFFGDE